MPETYIEPLKQSKKSAHHLARSFRKFKPEQFSRRVTGAGWWMRSLTAAVMMIMAVLAPIHVLPTYAAPVDPEENVSPIVTVASAADLRQLRGDKKLTRKEKSRLLALALRHVPSTHGAVVTALLPLSTALLGALWYRQRPSAGFWACAVLGSGLVLGFMVWRAGGLYLGAANVYLLIAMTTGALGYIGGARLTPRLGAEQVICWVCLGALPLTLPAALWLWPANAADIRPSAWGGFLYVGSVSMWAGFFAWYRGLDWGGALRVSQTQLLQPFLAMLFAWPLLGERLRRAHLALLD